MNKKPIKLGKSKAVEDVTKCYEEILTGTILCVDPSSGSGSSMPGYALYEAGELQEHGIVDILKVGQKVQNRLRELAISFRDDFDKVDVLVIEDIPPIHGGGRGRFGSQMKSHASLLKSVGCIIGAVDSDHVVSIHPRVWQKWKDENYVKSDHADATYIGIAAIEMSKMIKEKIEKAKAKKGKK